MANYNKAILVGNLTRDPELRYTPQGTAVVNISLAINRKYKSGDEMKEEISFVPVVAWGKTAELINQYCSKGSPLMVEGRIQTRSWEKDGQKQYKTEVVTENIQFLGQKKQGQQETEDKPALPSEEKPEETQWLGEDK
jgi:single-strand DNA-binding protein